MLLIIFVETKRTTFISNINHIINVFTVTFDKFNESLLKKKD